MRKESFVFISIVFLTICCWMPNAARAQEIPKFSRPTVIAEPLKKTPFYHRKIYEDAEYLFASRHYGKSEYVPGFFIFSKHKNKWSEVKKITTENAKLGHYGFSEAFETEDAVIEENGKQVKVTKFVSRKPDFPILAVTWDFREYENSDYAPIPLRTTASIVLPDKIVYDAAAESYLLSFGSDYSVEDMNTRLWVLKEDLRKVFK